jgi:hypothetical protein
VSPSRLGADEDGHRRGLRAVGVLLALALVAGLAWRVFPPLLSAAGGPEPEVLTQLKLAERDLQPMPVPGADAAFAPSALHFDRISVSIDGERATAVATLDARGRLGPVEVSSLGRERIAFTRRAGRWELDGVIAPSLGGALSALALRARLLDGASADALAVLVAPADRERVVTDPRLPPILGTPDHRWEPERWYLRSEREDVLATEEALLHRPGRPTEARAGRFRLLPSAEEGGRFVFEGGVL